MNFERDWKALLAIVIIILGLGIALWYAATHPNDEDQSTVTSQSAPDASANEIVADFACAKGTIRAVFSDKSVHIVLPDDGREMTLPQTISADGGRYANADESFVFWNKGNTAFVQENGTTTYDQCVTNS
ncbi:MAG: MliC family protein [Candidatus Kaiserbacteria bacterium]|nr:MliC family protein [Candidatus Kaiserbacteria bacterium]